jgi:hypothetical protein
MGGGDLGQDEGRLSPPHSRRPERDRPPGAPLPGERSHHLEVERLVDVEGSFPSQHDRAHVLSQGEVPPRPFFQEPSPADEDSAVEQEGGWEVLPLKKRLVRPLVERKDAIAFESLRPVRMLVLDRGD